MFLTLNNKFNETLFSAREQHVSQQTGDKKIHQNEQNPKFKSKSIFTENTANGQSWCRESFAEDHNTTRSTYLP